MTLYMAAVGCLFLAWLCVMEFVSWHRLIDNRWVAALAAALLFAALAGGAMYLDLTHGGGPGSGSPLTAALLGAGLLRISSLLPGNLPLATVLVLLPVAALYLAFERLAAVSEMVVQRDDAAARLRRLSGRSTA
jgi:hypothetical protein